MRTPFRLAFYTAAAVFAFAGSTSAQAVEVPGPTSAPNPFALYGPELLFDVYRNGDKVGFHRTGFAREGQDLAVNSRFEIAIEFLSVTFYRYRYESDALWSDGRLETLKAEVDDDGTRSSIVARRNGDNFVVETADGQVQSATPLYPTNHWNPGVLNQDRVLNTLTGRINEVEITAKERSLVATEQGEVEATHYVYSGDLQTEVWYDDAGRWVKMRFEGTDGSTIEYFCRRCLGTGLESASK